MKVEIETKEIPRVQVTNLPCLATIVNSAAKQVFLLSNMKNPVSMRSDTPDTVSKTLNVAVTHLQGEGATEIISSSELGQFTPYDEDASVVLKN